MRTIIFLQGYYYIFTGLWPVFNMSSFEKITGKKTDKWLVKQVGLLAAAIGISLLFAQYPDKRIVAVPAAIAFMLIDFYYALVKRIPKIYMADGSIQIIFIVSWIFAV
jgi:hypothetical protein